MNTNSRSWRQWLSSARKRPQIAQADGARGSGFVISRVIELLFFALLLPVAGLFLFPDNPTGLQSGFAWVMAPCVVFAARYGSFWGICCAALTALFINLPMPAYSDASSSHLVLGIGMCVLSLFVGEATSMLSKRYVKAEAENDYLRHRLEVFSTDYHVLKVSHGQLEEYMAAQRLSLREALQRLKPLLDSGPEGVRASQDLMAVFAQFCSVQIAGLYVISANGLVNSSAVATHGNMLELPQFDPLLRLALQQKQLVSIKRDMLAEKHHANSLLAVVPLVDFNERVHGVLAIKDMHFMAFQQENLNLLALLGCYLGNLLTRSAGVQQTPAAGFFAELQTVVRFAKQGHVDSMLLSMQFEPSEQGSLFADFICQSVRSLDSSLVLQSNHQHHVVGLILPLMTEQAEQAFRSRLETAVNEHFGTPLNHLMQNSQSKRVTAKDSVDTCLAFFTAHADDAVFDLTALLGDGKSAA